MLKIRRVLLLCLILCSCSCGRFLGSITYLHSSAQFSLSLFGASTIATGYCRAFLLKATDGNGNLYNMSSNYPVVLAGNGSGKFYSDPGCSSQTSGIILPVGSSYEMVYFKDSSAENLTLAAYGAGSNLATYPTVSQVSALAWNQMSPAISPYSPSGIYMQKTAYHWIRNTTIIYGGDTNGTFYNSPSAQMWEYNGTNWSQICSNCGPGPREGHALVYDSARNRIILFGGSASTTGAPPATVLNDVWEWDGNSWTQKFPGGVAVPGLSEVMAAYDSTRKRMVVFGGIDGTGTYHNTVYEYDGTNWYAPAAGGSIPTARGDVSNPADFDPIHGVVYIYAGITQDNGANNPFDDLYSWNGSVWTQICTSCTGTTRGGTFISFDQARNKLVVVQGFHSGVNPAGVWEMDGALQTWSGPTGGDPTPRDTGSFTFNLLMGHSLFLFGNNAGVGGNLDDTWIYGGP